MEKPEQPASIVIVDDDPALTELLVQYINVIGFRATSVVPEDAEQVVSSIIEHPPDVVLLDIHLGDVSGSDVARDLRQQGYTGTLVAMTALHFTEPLGQGRLAGFDALWPKPIDPDAVKQTLILWAKGTAEEYPDDTDPRV